MCPWNSDSIDRSEMAVGNGTRIPTGHNLWHNLVLLVLVVRCMMDWSGNRGFSGVHENFPPIWIHKPFLMRV